MAADRFQDTDMSEAPSARPARLRSTVTAVRKQKGRGFREDDMDAEDERNDSQQFESVQTAAGAKSLGAQKSVEGWVVFVSNVHEEASDEDITEAFMEFGNVKNLYLNLDRRTGFVKGYALVEYETQREAQAAIDGMNGQPLFEQLLNVTWCFSTGANRRPRRGR